MREVVTRATLDADAELGVAEPGRQLTRAAQEVGMDVRLEDVGDGDAEPPGALEVDFDVRARIDDRRGARRVVADEIGEVGDPLG